MNRYNYNRSDLIGMDEDLDEEDAVLVTAQRLVEGALFICIFLLILVFMQNKDLQDRIDEQQSEVKKYSGLLAECLNGGAVIDRNTNKAIFCDKAIEVQL